MKTTQQPNQKKSFLKASDNASSPNTTKRYSRSTNQSRSSMLVPRGSKTFQLRSGIFLSDITIGIILSSSAFLVEYFCNMWFESVAISKHYKTAIRVSFQLVAVVIAIVIRELLQKLFRHINGKDDVHVHFTTELFGVILGGGLVITILFLVAQKN